MGWGKGWGSGVASSGVRTNPPCAAGGGSSSRKGEGGGGIGGRRDWGCLFLASGPPRYSLVLASHARGTNASFGGKQRYTAPEPKFDRALCKVQYEYYYALVAGTCIRSGSYA